MVRTIFDLLFTSQIVFRVCWFFTYLQGDCSNDVVDAADVAEGRTLVNVVNEKNEVNGDADVVVTAVWRSLVCGVADIVTFGV